MTYPRLTIDLGKVRHNLDTLTALCSRHGISVAAVSKVLCAAEPLVRLYDDSDAMYIADSRLTNLARMQTRKQRMLLRIAQPSEAADVVRYADVSLQSEETTLRALAQAAAAQKKRHRIVLMIDLGDLREGIYCEDRAAIERFARAACEAEWLELYGVGTNLTCFGGILPDEANLSMLCETADWLRAAFNVPLPLVSGGNSSSLTMLGAGNLPAGITNLRLGESVLLGNDTARCCVYEGLYGDACVFTAELVELRQKPSVPVGRAGANAFGEHVAFADLGPQVRGILAAGRQDVDETGLAPLDTRVRVLGASSDHLIVDLTRAPGYRAGDTLSFIPSYGALLRAATSPYVTKKYD